ncbi:methylenetetrahydrofolate reductase [NAD(P)H] [Dasania marina]|uniref:methylenetetrahydrofolate reductase [NAD(P)H] n=1 Tax=Dasania marina TaxID=471499 RepID=UPI00036E620B|nr:methylenetetrahydrofolate reductase [NAD(P)H] [Dasania marina]
MSKRFSFEFFPAKTDAGKEKLKLVRSELNQLNPDFFSVTYGAGGSTRDNTKDIVLEMIGEGIDTAPHLSFGSDSKEEILELINGYKDAGVNRMVALRGDMPSGLGAQRLVYASELVAFIREHTGDHFNIEVGCYPEIHPDADNYAQDIQFLKEKLDAGANSAITQYFFNVDAYFHFLEKCAKIGIDKPIYPGIMPIINHHNLARFSKTCGAEIPRWLGYKLECLENDPEGLKAFTTDFVSGLCERLLAGGAPGLHFYTMNLVEPNKAIWQNLKLS